MGKVEVPPSAAAVSIRPVRWNDFEGLYELRINRYDQIARDPNYGMISEPFKPTPGEFASWFGELHRAILEGRKVCSVAEEEGRIVAMASVSGERNGVESRHIGTLGVEVLPDYQGRGIGRAVLVHVLEACRGRFEMVDLSVIPVNERAARLYRQLGFEVYGTKPRAFQRNGAYHDLVLMRKFIEPLAQPPTSGSDSSERPPPR
jgi:ribosomal protein S18 acetylase RimI-like enzyme